MIRNVSLRFLISLVLIIGVLNLGLFGFAKLASLRQPPAPRDQAEQVFNVEGFRVDAHPIQEYLNTFGTAVADREAVLAAEVSGKIVWINERFDVGQEMQAPPYPRAEVTPQDANPELPGDVLVRIDPETYAERVAQIAARIAETRTELMKLDQEETNLARVLKIATHDYDVFYKDYERRIELIEKGVKTEAERSRLNLELKVYERAKVQAENEASLVPSRRQQLKDKITSLEVEQRLAEQDRTRTIVRPPFNGYLSEVHVELGSYVRVGEPIARITDYGKVIIAAPLTLRDYAKLKPALGRGDLPKVSLALHAEDPDTWFGEVVRVAPEADQQSRTIMVYIEVHNSRQKVPLLPGTFVQARIEGPTYDPGDVLAVPRDAVRGTTVFVFEDGIARQKQVTVRENLQSLTLVSAGVAPGDVLVLTNLDVIADGSRINVGDRVRGLSDEMKRLDERLKNLRIVPESAEPATP